MSVFFGPYHPNKLMYIMKLFAIFDHLMISYNKYVHINFMKITDINKLNYEKLLSTILLHFHGCFTKTCCRLNVRHGVPWFPPTYLQFQCGALTSLLNLGFHLVTILKCRVEIRNVKTSQSNQYNTSTLNTWGCESFNVRLQSVAWW